MSPEQLREMEGRATKGPWNSTDKKRGRKKSVWAGDSVEREDIEGGPSRYGPRRIDIANFQDQLGASGADNAEFSSTLRNLSAALIDLWEAVVKRDNAERNLEAVCRDPEGQDDALRIEEEMPDLNERIRTTLARLKEQKQ